MFGRWATLPPVVKNLLIINGLLFLATETLSRSIGLDLRDLLGLHWPTSERFQIYQIVTHIFMHGSVTHLFFNMFAVWIFGSAIEQAWGSKRFLIYYMLTGLGAAFLYQVTLYVEMGPVIAAMESIIMDPTKAEIFSFLNGHDWVASADNYMEVNAAIERLQTNSLSILQADPDNPAALREARNFFSYYLDVYKDAHTMLGASGALFGILIAFGMMYPNEYIVLLFPPIPIKAKWFVTAYGAIELFSAFQNSPGDNVAHFAHLGGLLFGFLIIKIWQKTGNRWR